MATINTRLIGRNIVEAMIVVLLVFIAFFLLIRLLDSVFPQGTTLQQFMSDAGVFNDKPLARINKRFAMELTNQAGSTNQLSVEQLVVAKIESINNVVKSKKANNLTWNRADVGRQLYNLDAVQTFKDSSSKILFDNESFIDLGENSLIIIKQLERGLTDQSRNPRLIL